MDSDGRNMLARAVDALYPRCLGGVISPVMFRYGVCGVVNMMLDAAWYFVIYHFIVCGTYTDLGLVVVSPHIMSLAAVFPITFLNGFFLNRNVVFLVRQPRLTGQMGRYALTVVGSVILNYVAMKLLVEVCMIWPTPSKILTTVVCTLYSYLVGRYYTFRSR